MKTQFVLIPDETTAGQALLRFWRNESGQDLLEFALVAALLSLCAVASLQNLSSKVMLLWAGIASSLAHVLG